MPRFSSKGFSRGNRRSASTTATVTQYADFTVQAAPAIPSGGQLFFSDGAAKIAFRAAVPTFAGAAPGTSAPEGTTLGEIKTGAGNYPFAQANPDIQVIAGQYTHGVVTEAKIELRIIPEGATAADPNQGQYLSLPDPPAAPEVGQAVYTPEASVSLSLSSDPNIEGIITGVSPQTGESVSDAFTSRRIDRAFNTTVRYCRQTVGAEATAAVISGTYDPHRIYAFEDLNDHLDLFSFETNLDGTLNPSDPINMAYWVLCLGPHPAGTSYINSTLDPTIVPGLPVPHRVSARITSRVLFYTPEPSSIDNVPLSGAQANATGPGLNFDMGGLFDGANAQSFDRSLPKRAREDL